MVGGIEGVHHQGYFFNLHRYLVYSEVARQRGEFFVGSPKNPRISASSSGLKECLIWEVYHEKWISLGTMAITVMRFLSFFYQKSVNACITASKAVPLLANRILELTE